MNNSASRFDEQPGAFGSDAASDGALLVERALDPYLLRSVMAAPVSPEALLAVQRLALQEIPVLCVCEDFRAAQRYYCESLRTEAAGRMQTFLVHEMMPAHQQDYVLNGLNASRDYSIPCNAVVFTSRQFVGELVARLEWFADIAEVVYSGKETGSSGTRALTVVGSTSAASVSCICLRAGAAGRWVLMDHDEAATVQADVAPRRELVERLLRHTVKISGDRLAPYIAMMFDVPQAWKVHPELATRSLLVFNADLCSMGCYLPGVPQRIVWSDVLGIVFER